MVSVNNSQRILQDDSFTARALLESGEVKNAAEAVMGAKNAPLSITGAYGSFPACIAARLHREGAASIVCVTATEREAEAAKNDLALLGVEAALFPSWGTLPYHALSPNQAVFGERGAALASLLSQKNAVLVTSLRALLSPVPPPSYLRALVSVVKKGESLDTYRLAQKLTENGYTRTTQVQFPGEFVLRGEVLDIFTSGAKNACRLQFDYDKVESIKMFDVESQAGLEQVESLVIPPQKEVIWDDDRAAALEKALHAIMDSEKDALSRENYKQIEQIMEAASVRRAFSGEELFYPLAFSEKEGNASLLDYFPSAIPIFFARERIENAAEALVREFSNSFQAVRRERFVPNPEKLLLPFEKIAEKTGSAVSFLTLSKTVENEITFNAASQSASPFFGNIELLREKIASWRADGFKVFIAGESEAQARRIETLLRGKDAGNGEQDDSLSIEVLPLSEGFALSESRLVLITEGEIFGRKAQGPASLKTAHSSVIDTFVELEQGDFVVHLNYGIGVFKGIERISALGRERDYVKLEYAGEETVFVPIEQVNLVQRYIGNEGQPPRLDSLGSKSWENRKTRAKKSVEDIAERLVALYSRRKKEAGFPFPADTEWQTMFEAAFPFDETIDQLRCVAEIKADMEAPHPMDRLVCGDVGYGKTEVALRAVFKAVMGGKQAAFLAPTTILAEQHFENFKQRFGGFPVNIAMMSRLVDGKTQRKTLAQIADGTLDLVVGTHRLLQKDVAWKNLGLIVVDEEQRFGVKDKERLKELKVNVDCLTLSATPIPRTLHMSLLKIRDMSLLATPPRNRHPIETTVEEWSEERTAYAMREEAKRGGQVFFLHNRIEDLVDVCARLQKLVPELLMETAHGQMGGAELENVMHRFVHGGFHVLVSTTIIENGIDIPNVNTIIIDRADRYGVSQLYQLRGRVGRSDRLAYAYLFYPRGKSLSEVAMKRLEVISDFTELGSGFKIAMKDMEIRGAGNLLGAEQSGDILSVGFDLYMHLLDEAIHKLEDENYAVETETLLELEYTGFIPDSYIDSGRHKMEVYKKIAAIRESAERTRVTAELVDRFGPLPPEADSLLALADIRIICRELEIASIKEKGGAARVEFSRVANINIDKLMRLMYDGGGSVKVDPATPNVLVLQTGSIGLKEKSAFLKEKLAGLV